MIDIRGLRQDAESVCAGLARKGAAAIGRELLDVDTAWRDATARFEALRAQQKQQSGRPSVSERRALVRRKDEIQAMEAEQASLERRRTDLLDRVPNPPADDVPDGGEDDFEVLREVGERPSFDFPVRDHHELTEGPGWIDVERGAKVSGSRFAYRAGDLALLELALSRARVEATDGASCRHRESGRSLPRPVIGSDVVAARRRTR